VASDPTRSEDSDLRVQAVAVRRLLVAFRQCEPDGVLLGFPDKCCRIASYCLGRHLARSGRGMNLEWVEGLRGAPGASIALEGHCWLRVDELDIDITADQFEERQGSPVLLARRSSWHAEFAIHVQRRPFDEARERLAIHPECRAALDELVARMDSLLDVAPANP